MAYTYHTVASAEREIRVVDAALERNRRELEALRLRRPEARNRWAENVHVKQIGNLTRRRAFLVGELEKARENEAKGIAPLGNEE